jgi:hypothetical protein
MAQNIGTLLGAAVRPADSEDQFPAFHADEGKGGFYSVSDLTARDAIFEDRRVIGMRVKVISEDKDYELVGGIANSNWIEKTYGSSATPTLQSVTEQGSITDITVEFESGIIVDTLIRNGSTDDFVLPTDEPGGRIVATREWVALNAPGLTPTQESELEDAYDHSQETGNPHNTQYSELGGIPSSFTPSAHTHTLSDITDASDLASLDQVDEAQIVNHAVTNVKLAQMNAFTFKGRLSGNGTPQDNDVSDLPISTATQTALDTKQNNATYITANTTAVNNGKYIANGTFTITDIDSPEAGFNYEVIVRGGSVTIDGVAFDAGSIIRRVYNGTTWLEYYFNPLPLIFTGADNLTTSRLWNNRVVKIVNSAPITVTLNGDVECSGNQESVNDITFVSGDRVALAANATLVISSGIAGSLFMLSKSDASGTASTRVYINTL